MQPNPPHDPGETQSRSSTTKCSSFSDNKKLLPRMEENWIVRSSPQSHRSRCDNFGSPITLFQAIFLPFAQSSQNSERISSIRSGRTPLVSGNPSYQGQVACFRYHQKGFLYPPPHHRPTTRERGVLARQVQGGDLLQAVQRSDLTCAASIDLKNAFFHLGAHKSFKRWLRIRRGPGSGMQMVGMPFGIASAPYWCNKLFKNFTACLRAKGMNTILYADDLLILGVSNEQVQRHVVELISTCTSLGIWINFTKSHLNPTQHPAYLGMILNLVERRVQIPVSKIADLMAKLMRLYKAKNNLGEVNCRRGVVAEPRTIGVGSVGWPIEINHESGGPTGSCYGELGAPLTCDGGSNTIMSESTSGTPLTDLGSHDTSRQASGQDQNRCLRHKVGGGHDDQQVHEVYLRPIQTPACGEPYYLEGDPGQRACSPGLAALDTHRSTRVSGDRQPGPQGCHQQGQHQASPAGTHSVDQEPTGSTRLPSVRSVRPRKENRHSRHLVAHPQGQRLLQVEAHGFPFSYGDTGVAPSGGLLCDGHKRAIGAVLAGCRGAGRAQTRLAIYANPPWALTWQVLNKVLMEQVEMAIVLPMWPAAPW